MFASRRGELVVATVLMAPAVAFFALIFVYPTIQMFILSFTNAPLIGAGSWVGFSNYIKQLSSPLFYQSLLNTAYFVVLTVVPGTLVALFIAMGVNRQKGWVQAFVLACFFLPSILPVSVVTLTWSWMLDLQYGVLQPILKLFNGGRPLAALRLPTTFMPVVAVVTIWWTIGFNILLFLAALRNVSTDIYEAAALDNTNRWRVFSKITWPLIWPVTALVLTLQLIAQVKVFTQVYLLGAAARPETSSVLMKLVYELAFKQNKGGEGATVAVLLFLIIISLSVLQFQFLRARGGSK
jgi:multiple sugar transport system permease protein